MLTIVRDYRNLVIGSSTYSKEGTAKMTLGTSIFLRAL